MPTMLAKQGFPIATAIGVVLLFYCAEFLGACIAGFLVDKLDRKWTLVAYLLGAIAAAHAMAVARDTAAVTAAGMATYFCLFGIWSLVYTCTPELYPTAFRSTGMGLASAVGRIGSIAGPMAVAFSFSQIGFSGVFILVSTALALGLVGVVILGRSTKGKSLEQIAAEEGGRPAALEPA